MAKPAGKRGSWFAKWQGTYYPCVHKEWASDWPRYLDRYLDDDPHWPDFIQAIRELKTVVLTTDERVEGRFRRTGYIALYRVEDVEVEETELRFTFVERLIDASLHSEDALEDAALYPILAAFRVFLQKNKYNGDYEWIGSFANVKAAWEDLAYDLMKITHETSEDVGRSNNAIGKSRTHWSLVYTTVENYKLRQAAAALEKA